jgi:uncharacterized damage-inducible protein DinB
LQGAPQLALHYFEQMDWRSLDHHNMILWQEGKEHLKETQDQLVALLQEQTDDILGKGVAERNYSFRKLLHGLIQHDIYHLGQIAYAQKRIQQTEKTN